VASRVCPKCSANISAGIVAAYSDGIECPNCHTRLEVSAPGRTLDAWAGMAAAWIAWRFTRGGPGILGAVEPLLFAVLAFGAVSALVVIFTGDLCPAPELSTVEAVSATGHGHH
jgi:hypothetical protein